MTTRRLVLIVLAIVVFASVVLVVLNTPTSHANAQVLPPSPTPTASPSPTTTAPVVPAYDHRNDVTGHTSSHGTVTRSGSCATSTSRVTYSGLGGTLFTWNQSAHWCWNSANTRVTSATFQTYPTTGNQLWNLWGCVACPSSVVHGGGVGTAYVYQRAYGFFRFCVTYYCQSVTTWVSQTVRPGGGYTGSSA